jgi:hypothetical protein
VPPGSDTSGDVTAISPQTRPATTIGAPTAVPMPTSRASAAAGPAGRVGARGLRPAREAEVRRDLHVLVQQLAPGIEVTFVESTQVTLDDRTKC